MKSYIKKNQKKKKMLIAGFIHVKYIYSDEQKLI